jgi:methyl-accepting chemotaxis protein
MTKRWRSAESRQTAGSAQSRQTAGSAQSRQRSWSAYGRNTVWRNERGQATFSLLIVVAVIAVAVILLQRTAWHAEHINDKAGVIAQSGSGINTATQAVLKLGRTNELASSILDTAKPLQGKLDQIIALAKSVDGLATSINNSASTINGTAHGINGTASTILATARSINDGVAQINTNLDTTLALANAIKTDTGNILTNAKAADRELDCITKGSLTGNGAVTNPPAPC